MASTPTHHRVFAIVLALLFLATSVGAGLVVVYQIRQDNELAKEMQSQSSSDTESSLKTVNANDQSDQKGDNMLEGTKLANFDPVAKIDSLQKIDTLEGTGEEVKPGDTVTAHYTGAVAATGVIFQSSLDRGQPIPFSLNGVIKGWTDGVPGMKVGGKRRLLIPAALAYGANPPGGSGIPANADLVFDIEIVKIGE